MTDKYGPSGPFGPTFQLIPGVQSYEWGTLASDGSLVAEYAEATEELGFQRVEDKPYAELWMGTHATLPSKIIPPPTAPQPPVADDNSKRFISLSSYLDHHPNLIGEKVQSRFSRHSSANGNQNGSGTHVAATIPFLFKVLSIGKALSIQAHPDKELARKLHADRPKTYKDDNHKPEMTIALTEFQGFCGFRPLEEIATYLEKVVEFRKVIDADDALHARVTKVAKQIRSGGEVDKEEKKAVLREVFSKLMNAPSTQVKTSVMSIAQRYGSHLEAKPETALEIDDNLAELVCTLNSQFPGDIGVFCAFVLNVVELHPGEAMFLMANEPHAYLSGNIIECMAASDNVVRAGLTPKERDVPVLVDMLTYIDSPSDNKRMRPRPFLPDVASPNYSAYTQFIPQTNGHVDLSSYMPSLDYEQAAKVTTILYNPPIEEFSVLRTQLRAEEGSELQRAIHGPSILIITNGKGELTSYPPGEAQAGKQVFELNKPGQVFFIGANTMIRLRGIDEEEQLVVYRAFVEA